MLKYTNVRHTTEEKDRWTQAAELIGFTVPELARQLLNEKAAELLDCPHPKEFRKTYPWSDQCLRCGVRLRG